MRDLKAFYEAQPEFFEGKELYLLRNMSQGKGIGFFEAGNFYPDFVLWLVMGEQQNVAFVDPKGIRNLAGPADPKIGFYKTIKEIEHRLKDPTVTLSSFIVSNTPYDEVAFWGSRDELEERNVLFQQEGGHTYIERMLRKIFSANADVNAMWQRYRLYRLGKEPLLSMAYFCLSRLESTAMSSPIKGNKRAKTAGTYRVEEKVLAKLGEFTATLGDEVSARKMDGQSRGRPPTDEEAAWIEAALELLINRAAEHSADPKRQWSQIMMDDLPKL